VTDTRTLYYTREAVHGLAAQILIAAKMAYDANGLLLPPPRDEEAAIRAAVCALRSMAAPDYVTVSGDIFVPRLVGYKPDTPPSAITLALAASLGSTAMTAAASILAPGHKDGDQ